MKKQTRNRFLAVCMAGAMLLSQSIGFSVIAEEPAVAPIATQEDANKELTVLFEGEASASGSWDPWESLADILPTAEQLEIFASQPFTVVVEFEGGTAPVLIFQSWTGGAEWAQFADSYTDHGKAYYSFDAISEAFGTDFSLLNRLSIRPNGSDVSITKAYTIAEPAKGDINTQCPGIAGEIASNITAGWNLGNTFDSYGDWIKTSTDGAPERYETAWGNPSTTKEMIDMVKAAGFNAIRLPVTWAQHIDDENGYAIDPAWMDRVEEVVKYVLDDDMYCILNLHHDTGTEGWLKASSANYEKNNEKFSAVWKQIADRFADYDSDLIFESFNEMLDESGNWSYPGGDAGVAINKYNQTFVDTVRATGGNNPERCVIVNSYAAISSGPALDDLVLPTDSAKDAMIVEVHCYNPYFFCAVISDSTTQDTWRGGGNLAVMNGMFYNLYLKFISKGVPAFIGEFAAANKENLEARTDWAKTFVTNAADYGIRCFWWDNGGTFEKDATYGYYTGMGILNRNTMTWEYPEIIDAITFQPTTTALYGDVDCNGSINIGDIIALARYVAEDTEAKPLTDQGKINADCNVDEKINADDLTMIARFLVKLITAEQMGKAA